MSLRLLDCTLRDGGYYNNWEFQDGLVKNYVSKIKRSNIDVVEIGFRFFSSNSFGKFGYTKENIVKSIELNKDQSLAVMINSAELVNEKNYKKKIKKLFVEKSKSKISLIRLATHLKDIKKIIPQIKYLKHLGYKIALNLMQIDKIKKSELISVLELLTKCNSVDVFYFADSFGNLNNKKVKDICLIIKKNWNKEFGFHAHDNCGLALKNSMCAIDNGAKWIDSTIMGMGRGAGNVSTEDLLKEIKKRKEKKYNLKPIKELSYRHFRPLKKKYKWGKSKYYFLSAKKNIHPSYVQEILVDKRYKDNQIIQIINELSKMKSSSFNPVMLKDLINKKVNGDWNAKNWCKNKNILILGQGDSIKDNKNKILKLIKNQSCKVLSLNINKMIEEKYIDHFLACHEARVMIDSKKYDTYFKKMIVPTDRFKDILKRKLSKKIKNYGMLVKKDIFQQYEKYCVLPSNLAIGYAISLSLIGNSKKIFLAGFDGYKNNHMLNLEMNNFFKILKKHKPALKITSITNTNYKIS